MAAIVAQLKTGSLLITQQMALCSNWIFLIQLQNRNEYCLMEYQRL